MSPGWIAAQCVMCYRTAAAQQAARARVLNSGIVVLLIPPILVLSLILWMAIRKKNEAAKRDTDGRPALRTSRI